MNDIVEHFKEAREQAQREANKRRGIDGQRPSGAPQRMKSLPLRPEDVTEFTCEAASKHRENIDWADFEKEAYRPFVQSLIDASIAAEWAHRIAMVVADIDFESVSLAEAGQRMGELRVFQSAGSLKDWLDSLKGGQNG